MMFADKDEWREARQFHYQEKIDAAAQARRHQRIAFTSPAQRDEDDRCDHIRRADRGKDQGFHADLLLQVVLPCRAFMDVMFKKYAMAYGKDAGSVVWEQG